MLGAPEQTPRQVNEETENQRDHDHRGDRKIDAKAVSLDPDPGRRPSHDSAPLHTSRPRSVRARPAATSTRPNGACHHRCPPSTHDGRSGRAMVAYRLAAPESMTPPPPRRPTPASPDRPRSAPSDRVPAHPARRWRSPGFFFGSPSASAAFASGRPGSPRCGHRSTGSPARKAFAAPGRLEPPPELRDRLIHPIQRGVERQVACHPPLRSVPRQSSGRAGERVTAVRPSTPDGRPPERRVQVSSPSSDLKIPPSAPSFSNAQGLRSKDHEAAYSTRADRQGRERDRRFPFSH